MKKIRAILVDDLEEFLTVFSEELSHYSEIIEIIGAYTDPNVAAREILLLKPDVLFLDVEMPGMSGFELTDIVRKICSNVIYLTNYMKYASESYSHDAIHFIKKGRIKKYLPEAIAKLIEKLQPEAPIFILKKINLKDGRRISITICNDEKEYDENFQLCVESYRTISKFIAYKFLGNATNQPAEFLINQNTNPSIFQNLSQAKIRFLKDVNQQLKNNKPLLPEFFFENTDIGKYAGDYTLNTDAEAISFSFKLPGLKLWADNYIKEIIEIRKLSITYQVEDDEIIIFKK